VRAAWLLTRQLLAVIENIEPTERQGNTCGGQSRASFRAHDRASQAEAEPREGSQVHRPAWIAPHVKGPVPP
jgi:hypothetical protein